EATQPLLIRGDGRRENLDGHLTTEPGVTRAVDLAHAARAQWGENLVRAEVGAGRDGHDDRLSAVGLRGRSVASGPVNFYLEQFWRFFHAGCGEITYLAEAASTKFTTPVFEID